MLNMIKSFSLDFGGDPQAVAVPEGAQFLTVKMVGARPAAFFMVNQRNKVEIRKLMFVETDKEIPFMNCHKVYLCTVVSGVYVAHLLELCDGERRFYEPSSISTNP